MISLSDSLFAVKKFPGTPLSKTEEVPEESSMETQLIHLLPKPLAQNSKNGFMVKQIKGFLKIQF